MLPSRVHQFPAALEKRRDGHRKLLTLVDIKQIIRRLHFGGVPERSKGSDCKSDGSAFVGSNPTPSTRSRKLIRDGLAEAEVHKFAGMV